MPPTWPRARDARWCPSTSTAPATSCPRVAAGSRRARTTVTFGTPLWPAEGEDARRFAARIEAAVATLADESSTDWWTARRQAAAGTTPSLQGPDVAAWRRAWALDAAPDAGRGRGRRGQRLASAVEGLTPPDGAEPPVPSRRPGRTSVSDREAPDGPGPASPGGRRRRPPGARPAAASSS